jgi:uncharacterized protein
VSRSRALGLLVFVVGLGLCAVPVAVAGSAPPTPSDWVTDGAGALSNQARSTLDQRLSRYAASSGHQLLVWIGDTTGDTPLEEFAARAFEQWRVGRKGLDDGIVVFLLVKDRRVRIEVGYGLEGKVPDAIASRIIRDTIVPRLRSGDMDGAVSAGVDAIITAIEGPPSPEPGSERGPERPSLSLPQLVLATLGVLLLLALLATHPSLAAFFLINILSGGRRDGGGFGGGGGGGFRGGGGRSGGGGASGSW